MATVQIIKETNVLTWRVVLERIKDDSSYPSDRKSHDTSRLRKALTWNAAPSRAAAQAPKRPSVYLDHAYDHSSIDQLFDALRASELGVTEKTLQNARSACRRVADHYETSRPIGWTPLSDDCMRARDMVPGKWDRCAIMPVLRYLSFVGSSPWAMTDDLASDFLAALKSLFRVINPKLTFRHATRVWNKLAKTDPQWPQVTLQRQLRSLGPSIDWGDYKELEQAIDAHLARGRTSPVDHEDGDADGPDSDKDDDTDESADFDDAVLPLAAETLKSHKGSLRLVIWALQHDGVQHDELVALTDLCAPRRYRRAMRVLTERAGGQVNRTVMRRADVLLRLATHSGVLSKQDVKTVRKAHAKYSVHHSQYLKTHVDRDQATLDQLDDPSVMDALLSLPTRTKEEVLRRRNRMTISCAFAIQKALVLELWLCAPYRIGAFVSIDLEQIIALRLESIERLLLRGPKRQAFNKKSPEHLLNEDTIDLLRLYLRDYHPMIVKFHKTSESSALFPGQHGKAKTTSALRLQMTHWVRRHTSLNNWHPHVMRKIVPKITLDADPGAIEVARRSGGWSNDKMLRKLYGQHVHRASQVKYLEFLEGRRLSSVRSLHPRRSKKA